jgi:hypothetical protein
LRPSPAIDSFHYTQDVYGALAVGDVDGDGQDDLIASGQWTFTGVFLGRGNFDFRDGSEQSGLSMVTSRSLALGDLDNDGDLDLVTTERFKLRVFGNDGQAHFTQASEYAAPEVGAEHLLLVDIDNDGLLDVYGGYPPNLSSFEPTAANHLFQNRGELQFEDVSEAVQLPEDGKTWASGACDLDGDDDQDIVVANDSLVIDFGDYSEPTDDVDLPFNGALINQNAGQRLEDRAEQLGLQGPYSSMGVQFEDLDRDGQFEIFISDYGANKLMQGSVDDGYVEVAADFGLDPAHRVNDRCDESLLTADCLLVSWGALFRDFDLDGQDELLVANHQADRSIGQPMQLFKRDAAGGMFQEYSLGIPSVPMHALVAADFDADGDLDFAASTVGQGLLVFENTVGDRCEGNWLSVRLEGSSSNRQGLGATVTLEQDDGQQQMRLVTTGGVAHGSLLAEAHFGLGEHQARRLTVHWPNGVDSVLDAELDELPEHSQVTIEEPR